MLDPDNVVGGFNAPKPIAKVESFKGKRPLARGRMSGAYSKKQKIPRLGEETTPLKPNRHWRRFMTATNASREIRVAIWKSKHNQPWISSPKRWLDPEEYNTYIKNKDAPITLDKKGVHIKTTYGAITRRGIRNAMKRARKAGLR